MIITAIEKLKKAQYKVYIDGEYAFSCNSEDLSYLGIEEGKEIDNEQYNYYVNYIAIRRAKDYAFKLLSKKIVTEKELYQKLKIRGFSENVINEVIEKLKSYNYINDEIYAKLFIEQKMNQLHSRKKIYYELINKGINREVIQESLRNFYPKEKEVEIIKKIIEKKLKFQEDTKKLKNYLYNSGFEIENISTAFREKDL
ncbi:regulatory protein RecX [Thermoanaerobacter mathranii subsp. mathranii str. A3]|jgi:regulatory protein|uniref:Regulatory protein RecX n=3 Tax=Thermoanaerobacter TaxID=1754 RepID=D3T8Z9_THEIA|nr:MULTISPECIES: regulatory protein RecX [Thermoanaerobacter]ADD02431.1 regulatory protein RecX [Thermoanaerobacter italicus Ab9]ADH60934.1 regulatory protein RecX [Thermoanaerobacter mathranii subsp. mathranii str. A3]MDP9751937.1 regulatory protein [Thermoanaerobacter pentosaceus]